MQKEIYEKDLASQLEKRRKAVELIRITNDLWYEKSIELVFFRHRLLDCKVSEILNLQHYAVNFVEKPISISTMLEVAKAIEAQDLVPAKLDLGKLTFEFQSSTTQDVYEFIAHTLHHHKLAKQIAPKDVVLYGFGRIGRLLARELMIGIGRGNQLRLRAIVTRGEITETVLEKRAALLRRDSVHGEFPGTVAVDIAHKRLIINGTKVEFISAKSPELIDYTQYGINHALVIDNTGVFRTKEELGLHLKAKGVAKVLLTAPGKENVPNIVYGVNQNDYNPDELDIFSAASCTTNAITPVLKVVNDTLKIKHGHLETIHAYTNDQNLVDNIHKKYRRGRAAALNMVITETGAGKAVAKALPELDNKLSSNAIRVPVPNGSLAILNLELQKTTTTEEINRIIKEHALNGELVEQIEYSVDNELVSSDIVGSRASSIFDSKATITSNDGKNAILYVWYDNEYGYSQQVMRLAKYIAKVRRFTYY